MSQFILKVITGLAAWTPSVALLALLFGCDYESHETYVKEIPEPDLSNLSIKLSNPNDTLYLFGKTTLNYQALLNGRQTYGAYVYLDGFQIETLQGNDTTFTIDAENYEEGVHILRLEIYASAGTGSLGDVAGAEQLILAAQWAAYISNSPPETVDFSSIGIHDASMVISWSRYPGPAFSAYVLEKQYWNQSYNMYSTCWQKEFTDKDITSFKDSTYLGGKIQYRVRIRAGELFSAYTTKQVEHVYDPAIAYEWIDREQARITWHKPRLSSSFKNYEFSFKFANRTVVTAIADTAVIVKPEISFGQTASFSLIVHANGDRCENGSPMYMTISLGDRFPSFTGSRISYCQEIDQYFTREYTGSGYNLIRIDGKTNTVEQSTLMDGEFAISPNGKNLYITYDNVLRQLDPMTFAVIKTYNLYELNDMYTSLAGNFTVSDNHHISIVTYDGNYVVQMPDFKVLYKGTRDYSMGMSPSGNTLVSNGRLWSWNGSSFTEKHSFADSFQSMFKDDNTLIKIYYNDKISIQNLSTYQEKSVAVLYPDIIVYDAASDLIAYTQRASGYNTTTSFNLIDMNGNTVKQFPVAQLDNNRGQHFLLVNNRILCSVGSSIPLSHYYP